MPVSVLRRAASRFGDALFVVVHELRRNPAELKNHPPERDVSHIVGSLSGFQQRKQQRKVPEGQLDGWTRDENGAPLTTGTPFDLVRPESRLIIGVRLRSRRPPRCPFGGSRERRPLRQ